MTNQDTLTFYTSKTRFAISFIILAVVAVVCAACTLSATGGAFWAGLALAVLTGGPACLYLYALFQKPQKIMEIGPGGIEVFQFNVFRPAQKNSVYLPWDHIEQAHLFSVGRLTRLSLLLRGVDELLTKQKDDNARILLRKGILGENEFLLTTMVLSKVSDQKLKTIINTRLEEYRQANPQNGANHGPDTL